MPEPESSTTGKLPVDPPDPPKADESQASLTRYMVLWAPKPDDGEPRKWREIGYYDAHNTEAAETKARTDQDSGQYGAMLDVAKARGIYLKPIAQRSWPDGELKLHTLEQPPPEWTVGGGTQKAGD